MKNLIFSLVLILSILSCEKDCICESPPFSNSCLGQTFEQFKANSKAIKIDEYTKGDESFYLLDGGESHYDGTSPIFNKDCDSVCYFGGWVTQPCFKEMTFKQNIWKR